MNSIKIQKVRFLVPIRVSCLVDGVEHHITGTIDYANQELFFGDEAPQELASLVLAHIKNTTHMPEDEFEANEDVYEQAGRAQGEYQNAHKQHVGDSNV